MAPTKKPSIAPTPKLSSLEFNSLHDFYNATHGPWWRWHNVSSTSVPWNFSIPNVNPCLDHWQGLQCLCALTTCEVIMIYLDHHNLTGHLPDSMRNFPKMQSLILRSNNITGTITSSIGNMTVLEELDLSYNQLEGEIPSSFGQLQSLKTLNLNANYLSQVPEELYDAINLETLGLAINRFVGTLSERLGNLFNLITLQLQENAFSQTLPNSIGNLTSLKTLDATHNNLYGMLPEGLYKLSNLMSLAMAGNSLNSTLSDSIGNLTNLEILELGHNLLTRTIPETIGKLTKLRSLQLNNNQLHGKVPKSIANLTSIEFLYLQSNYLRGTIDHLVNMKVDVLYLSTNLFTGQYPISSQQLSNVYYLDISENHLTGPVPWVTNTIAAKLDIYAVYDNYFSQPLPDLMLAPYLKYFLVLENQLSGSIPDNFLNQSSQLFYLGLSSNYFTGTIPENLGNFTILNQLFLESNYLVGTISENIGHHYDLVVLDVDSNLLTGPIPSSFTSLRFIEQLFVQNNYLTGNLATLFDGNSSATRSRQYQFRNIDLCDNQFTGSIPTSFFVNNTFLATFAASGNCFQGSIPIEICGARTLVTLSLDGLTTAENCRTYLFPNIPYLNAFTVNNFIPGEIPSCLYEMPFLELLHLSGNGFIGSLPSNLNISSSLIDLSLSHNELTGTIPLEFQERTWLNLDFSYNKLTGTLNTDFGSLFANGVLSLQVNRLSGSIPDSLLACQNITILNGNLFECNILGSDLPAHDPDYSSYSCGSDSVDDVLYAWIGIVAIAVVVIVILCRSLIELKRRLFTEMLRLISTWRNELRKDDELQSEQTPRINIQRLSIYFNEIRTGVFRLALVCIIILIPVYYVVKMNSSSYTLEYAWTVSALLVSGETAAIILFLFLLLFALTFARIMNQIRATINRLAPKSNQGDLNSQSSSITSRKSILSQNSRMFRYCVYTLVSFINLIITCAADFSYVYIVLSYSTEIVIIAAFVLALFRLATNHFILWSALPIMTRLLNSCARFLGRLCNHPNQQASMQQEEDTMSLQYSTRDISFLENLILFNNIIIPVIAIIFILPDCFYNALFAASNVESSYSYRSCEQYVAVLSIGHICKLQSQTIEYSPPYIYSFQCSSKIVINYVPVYVLMLTLVGIIIPAIKIGLKIVYDNMKDKESQIRKIIKSLLPNYFKEFRSNIQQTESETRSTTSLTLSEVGGGSMSILGRRKGILFNKLELTVQINSYLTILVCFGALFPPLAIIAALTICSITYFEELWIGWLLTETRQLGLEYRWYEEKIEKECEGVEESSNLTIWSTLFVSCSLYGYIIFDTMGDKTGWEAALPMTLLLMLLPLLLYLGVKIYHRSHLFGFSRCSPQNAELNSTLSGDSLVADDSGFGESNNPLRQLSKIQLISSERFHVSTAQNTIP